MREVREEMREARARGSTWSKDKRLAHPGKLVEMERKAEKKRGNEGGQSQGSTWSKDKRLAHPGKPVEMEPEPGRAPGAKTKGWHMQENRWK